MEKTNQIPTEKPLPKLTSVITRIEVVNNRTGKEMTYVKDKFSHGLTFFYNSRPDAPQGLLVINGLNNDTGTDWTPVARLEGHSIINITQIKL